MTVAAVIDPTACPVCGGPRSPGWRACGACLDWARRVALRRSIREAIEPGEADDLVNEFPVLPANFV